VSNSKTSTIFNYDFEWFNKNRCDTKNSIKEACCKKYKKKGEKKCKNCPKLSA